MAAQYHKDITMYFNVQTHYNQQQQAMSAQYQTLSYSVDAMPSCPERSVAMRKLLESYDAAMRTLSS